MMEIRDQDQFRISDEAFDLIKNTLKTASGFDLDIYKDKCVRRRIAIRVRATHCHTAEEYGELLRQSREEKALLLKVLTIHVSQFFRNPSTFAKLKEEIVPYLLDLRESEGERGVTCWSVGCAGGEEPYSLAMIIRDICQERGCRTKVRILATDVNANILEAARQGIYDAERLTEVSERDRERWLQLRGDRYHLLPEIKDMVAFERGDLSDTGSYPFCDLILCRNVLIYFERRYQEIILNRFADVLGQGGILVVGKSETLFGAIRSRFKTVCPIERIYRVN
jgi:chemotaxis protein methyltransferase CheR